MSENKSTLQYLADPAFQRRELIFERIGWACMGGIVLAALLGLFGKGFLSRAELKNASFQMEYDRFLHNSDLATLKLKIPPSQTENGMVVVAFSNDYLHKLRVERIIPEPESSTHGDQTLFWFMVTPNGQPASILLRVEPLHMGRLEGRISINGAEGHAFQQFVYP